MFKVVPDQLRISEGWVRCGQCTEIFDASAHLQQEPLMAAPAQPAVPAPDSGDVSADLPIDMDTPDRLEEQGDDPVDELDVSTEQTESVEVEAEPEVAEVAGWSQPGPDPRPPEIQPSEVPDVPADPGHVNVQLDEPRHAPVDEFVNEPTLMPLEGSDPALPEVSFVREARRKAFWRRPQIRWLLVGVCVVLVGLLALQLAVHERDRIAAFEPRTRPLLQALCARLQCTVAPLRQIESIVIDNSSFSKIRGGVFQLNLTVKNNAPIALAMPGIELALTDTQDQPVLRRVLLPADLGAAAVLAAGAEWTGSLPISVADNASAARIAGYRVLAFYP